MVLSLVLTMPDVQGRLLPLSLNVTHVPFYIAIGFSHFVKLHVSDCATACGQLSTHASACALAPTLNPWFGDIAALSAPAAVMHFS
jgi:hypothetical protein